MFGLLAIVQAAIINPTSVRDYEVAFLATSTILRSTLKDNQSARFRDVHFRSAALKDGGYIHGVCGYVNSRNSYGAYPGYKLFFGTNHEGKPKVLFEGAGAEDFCGPNTFMQRVGNDQTLTASLTTMVTASDY